jgi:hypothetical protein
MMPSAIRYVMSNSGFSSIKLAPNSVNLVLFHRLNKTNAHGRLLMMPDTLKKSLKYNGE